MKKLSILLAVGLVLGFSSCEKKYDTPPIKEIPEGTIKTISEVRAMYSGVDSVFVDDLTIRAVVVTDETSGNFYKETYIKDNTGGIKVRFTSSSSLSIGDSIRLQLNGGTLTEYNGMLSVDNLDPDESNVILKNNVQVDPINVSLDQVTGALQGQFIQIDNVEFPSNEVGTTWADPINQFSINHNLTDCSSNTVLVRTSGYSNFAGEVIPSGNGTLLGVVGVFGNDVQIFIRNPNEITMNGVRCAGGGGVSCDPLAGLNETFSSQIAGDVLNKNCWRAGNLQGSNNWLGAETGGDKFAIASGNASATQEMWMASPDIQSGGNDMLSFSSAQQNILTSTLTVMVSKNFNGTNYSSATWNPITATVASSSNASNTYVSSGSVSLSTALGSSYTGTYSVAFKANMANNSFSQFKVDNVIITQ
jgi:hypothetical protein